MVFVHSNDAHWGVFTIEAKALPSISRCATSFCVDDDDDDGDDDCNDDDAVAALCVKRKTKNFIHKNIFGAAACSMAS